MTGRSYPPDFVTLEDLAYRLSLKPEYVRQLVKRHLLPQPVMFGEAPRWRWEDVDRAIKGVAHEPQLRSDPPDPYMAGANGTETTATRPQS